jgi:hypothetical protein
MSTDDKITVPVIQVVMLAVAALNGRKLDYVPDAIWRELPDAWKGELNRIRTASAREPLLTTHGGKVVDARENYAPSNLRWQDRSDPEESKR